MGQHAETKTVEVSDEARELLRDLFNSLSLNDHKGDTNNDIAFYMPKFGLGEPLFCDEFESYEMPWARDRHIEENPDHEHDEEWR